MRPAGRIFGVAVTAVWMLTTTATYGQTTADSLQALLAQPVQPTEVTAFQLQQYLSHRIATLPSPANAKEWTDQQVLLINHYGLQMADPDDRSRLRESMKEFLNLQTSP